MAWNGDPIAVETCLRGTPIPSRERLTEVLRHRMNLQCGVESVTVPFRGGRSGDKRCVQSSLPCVAMVDLISALCVPARTNGVLIGETLSAKEAKNRHGCSGKHLGCLKMGRCRIAVRSKWQFGPGDGNISARTLKGNHHGGDAWQSAGKANRTSSRKIYYACYHFILNHHTA